MAGRAAQLAVELTESGADKVASGFDSVTSSAKRMGDTTEAAGRQAGKGLDTATEGADELASKGSQAAGALSGLGDLIGGPFGAAMQGGGIALQAAADSGDLFNAALENSIVSSARAKAATVGKTIADKASTVATKAMTVAQKALNLAMKANMIGLIITGVLLLVGLLVLAYKRSATFRAIVDKAMSVAKAGVDKVVHAFQALGPVVGKVMAFIGKIVGLYVKVYVTAFQLVLKGATAAWKLIQAAVGRVVDWLIDKGGDLKSKLGSIWEGIKKAGVAAFDAITLPLRTLIGLVEDLLDKIKSIHIPHPDLNPFNRLGVAGSSSTSSTVSTVNIYLTVNPPPGATTVQAQATAQATMDAIDNRLRSVGRRPVFAR